MDWGDVKNIISNVAPVVGAVLAPMTGGASVAVGALVSKAFGCENTPDDIAKAVQSDPNAALKLQELINSKEFAKLQNDLDSKKLLAQSEQNNLLDTQSSRVMYVTKSEQADKIAEQVFKYSIPLILGLIIADIAVSKIFENNAPMATAIGTLIGMGIQKAWDERATIINFFFGSSLGGRKAQEALINGK